MMNCGGLFGMAPGWYGITNAPNLCAQWALGNHGYTTNWGGRTQFNIFPSYMTESQMAGTKALMGQPVYPPTTGSFGIFSGGFANAGISEQQVYQNACIDGFQRGVKVAMDADIKNVHGVISGQKEELVKNAKDANLTAAQRDRMIQLLTQLEDAEHRLETMTLLRQQGANDMALRESLVAIKKQITQIQNDSKIAAKETQEDLQSSLSKQGVDTKDYPLIDGVKTQEEIAATQSDDTSEHEAATVAAENSSVDKRKEARELCQKFYKAIDGPGTDYKPFKEVIEALNEDNVVEVMAQWELSYGNSYEETFIESLLDDAGHYQKRNLGGKVLEALEKRAEKAGVNVDAQSAAVKMQLDSGWIVDKKVIKNINEMFHAIIAAENSEEQQAA